VLGEKTDKELITSALDGSERAWMRLVQRYEKRLYNYALRMVGNQDDAMDLMQDVLMSVYRNLATFRGDAPFGAWVFRIAAFRCTDHFRKRRFQQEEYEDQADIGSDPLLSIESVRHNGDIVKLLHRLPPDQRQVVELKFFQNFTFEEIGGQLGISTNTAKTRLYAALKKLRNSPDIAAIAC